MEGGPRTIAIRPAALSDAAQIAEIYNEGIAGLTSTFETEPRMENDIVAWFAEGPPLIAAEDQVGRLVGWGRVAPYSSRPCYAGVGEASVYVAEDSRGRGIGTALAKALTSEAEQAGFYKLLGKLFPENEASRRLVARFGFREVGMHLRHGRLDGEWRDVLLVELLIGEARA
jgi:L-amino acid N-acyltransferase YncA